MSVPSADNQLALVLRIYAVQGVVRAKRNPVQDQPIVIESLKLQFVQTGQMCFDGALVSERARSELRRCLGDVHGHIVREKLRSFTADVRRLQFVDSSAIRLFVDWISRAQEAKYKIVFLIDSGTTWQRLSFAVLKSLAPESVEIQEKEGSASTEGERST